jgi:inorganic pyrophosphatase/exopolyphosphatase
MENFGDTQKSLLVGAAAFLAGGLAVYSFNKATAKPVETPTNDDSLGLERQSSMINSSMDIFIRYLRKAKNHAKNGKEPLCIALGNTSGDMDSIVGALGMAYFLTLKTHKIWIPMVNCNKDELELKPEIYGHLISDCKIPIDDLLFYDELLSYKRKYAEFGLIDHNRMDDSQARSFSQDGTGEDVHNLVTHVWDHHACTGSYDFSHLHDYQVRFMGSACSILVIKMRLDISMYNMELFNQKNEKNFAYLLGAAISLDTHNFLENYRNTKWSIEDEESMQWLR